MASIQSQIMKFVIRRQKFFGEGEISPHGLRAQAERMAGNPKPSKKVQVLDVNAGSVPSEWVVPQGAPQDRALLYIHGGAWFLGSTKTHRLLVTDLAVRSGIRALSINYRLAPENPFPAGLDDCVTTYEWLLQRGDLPPLVVPLLMLVQPAEIG